MSFRVTGALSPWNKVWDRKPYLRQKLKLFFNYSPLFWVLDPSLMCVLVRGGGSCTPAGCPRVQFSSDPVSSGSSRSSEWFRTQSSKTHWSLRCQRSDGWDWNFRPSNHMVGSPGNVPPSLVASKITSLTWQKMLSGSHHLGNPKVFRSSVLKL